MRVSQSGYYSWRKREKSPRQIENENLIPIVKKVSKESRSTYGTRRISEEMGGSGISCGRYRARTLMNFIILPKN